MPWNSSQNSRFVFILSLFDFIVNDIKIDVSTDLSESDDLCECAYRGLGVCRRAFFPGLAGDPSREHFLANILFYNVSF